MHQIIYTIIIFLLCSCKDPKFKTSSEHYTAVSLFSKQKEVELKTFIKKWDIYFNDNWILNKEDIEEIDHFLNGYVIEWTKTENSIKYLRTYVFRIDSQFVSAYEERLVNDTLLSQGEIKFEKKEISYITQVIINKASLKKKNSYWDYEVEGYFYEIYNKGILSCIYKTIHLNHYHMLFEKENKSKIELVKGKDCLRLKKS